MSRTMLCKDEAADSGSKVPAGLLVARFQYVHACMQIKIVWLGVLLGIAALLLLVGAGVYMWCLTMCTCVSCAHAYIHA